MTASAKIEPNLPQSSTKSAVFTQEYTVKRRMFVPKIGALFKSGNSRLYNAIRNSETCNFQCR